jgi:hypothetical protein
MHADSSQCAVTKSAQRPLGVRARRAAWPLDSRTRASRKLRRLVADLGVRFGINADDPLLLRAAELSLAAELARRELIRGTPGASAEALVKLENLAARAARDLAIKVKAKPAERLQFGERLAQELADEAAT